MLWSIKNKEKCMKIKEKQRKQKKNVCVLLNLTFFDL